MRSRHCCLPLRIGLALAAPIRRFAPYLFVMTSLSACLQAQQPGIENPSRIVGMVLLSESLPGHGKAKQNFDAIFSAKANIAEVEVNVQTRILGPRDDGPSVIRTIGELPHVDAKSVVVFYYAGHGEIRRTDKGTAEHVLRLDCDGPTRLLPRSAVLRALCRATAPENERPRLVVLVTDSCCANLLDRPIVPSKFGKVSPQQFVDLFFRSRGIANINGASFDENNPSSFQRAWYKTDGGLFTTAFCDYLSNADRYAMLDANSDGRVTWLELFCRLNERTHRDFVDLQSKYKDAVSADPVESLSFALLRNQTDQRPMRYSLPE
jgi:hypothetical protein